MKSSQFHMKSGRFHICNKMRFMALSKYRSFLMKDQWVDIRSPNMLSCAAILCLCRLAIMSSFSYQWTQNFSGSEVQVSTEYFRDLFLLVNTICCHVTAWQHKQSVHHYCHYHHHSLDFLTEKNPGFRFSWRLGTKCQCAQVNRNFVCQNKKIGPSGGDACLRPPPPPTHMDSPMHPKRAILVAIKDCNTERDS